MKNISKRIACVVLSLLCVFMSTYTVYAGNSAEGDWEHLSNGHVVVNGVEYEPMEHNQYAREIFAIVNKLGIVGKGATSLANTALILGDFAIKDDTGNMYFRIDRKTEDGDNIKFSSDYVNGVRNGIADIIDTQDGFAYIPTHRVDCIPSYYFRESKNYDWYVNFCQLVKTGEYLGFLQCPSDAKSLQSFISGLYDISGTDAFYGNYSNASIPSYNDIYVTPSFYCRAIKNGFDYELPYDDSYPGISFSGSTRDIYDFYINSSIFTKFRNSESKLFDAVNFMFTSDGRAIKVYKTRDAYVKTLENHGIQNFYTSNTYNNYNVNNDNSITINQKGYNNTDSETINNNN